MGLIKQELLRAVEIEMVRNPIKQNADDWHETAHHWRVTINGETVDYYTGIGHRTPRAFRMEREDYARLARASRLTPDGLKQLLRCSIPTKPSVDDVIYSLVSDAGAVSMSFEDWCSDFGMDTDSRKALATYEACQQAERKLRNMKLGTLAELSTLFQDY